MSEVDSRLSRIEDKVDKLVDAMTNLVRIEEKLHMHTEGMQRLGKRMDDIDVEVKKIQEKMPTLNLMAAILGKIGLSVLTLVVVGMVGSFLVFK